MSTPTNTPTLSTSGSSSRSEEEVPPEGIFCALYSLYVWMWMSFNVLKMVFAYFLIYLFYVSVELVVEVETFVPDYTDEQLELLVS